MKHMIYTALDGIVGTIIAPSVAANDGDRKARLSIYGGNRAAWETTSLPDQVSRPQHERESASDRSES